MSTEYLNNKDFESMIKKFQSSKSQIQRHTLIIEEQLQTIKRKNLRSVDAETNVSLLEKSQEDLSTAKAQHENSKVNLATAFYLLSYNLVRYAKFNLIDEDDALQEGVVICFEKVDRFVPRKGRAFNYMTTCILNHFRQLYRSAKNYNELKKKYYDFRQLKITKTIFNNGKEKIIYTTDNIY